MKLAKSIFALCATAFLLTSCCCDRNSCGESYPSSCPKPCAPTQACPKPAPCCPTNNCY